MVLQRQHREAASYQAVALKHLAQRGDCGLQSMLLLGVQCDQLRQVIAVIPAQLPRALNLWCHSTGLCDSVA